MKINLKRTEILNLIIDLKIFLCLCPNLNKERTKRIKRLSKKLKKVYLGK